ncbi:hypothetical protein [Caulobacter segnis]
MLALGVFSAVFCVTFWRDSLFQGVGLAVETAPLTAREHQNLTTTSDVVFKKAQEQVREARGGDAPATDTPPLSAQGPKNSRVATLVVSGGNRLCHVATSPDGTERWIVDYDATHFNEQEGLKFSWRAGGCEAAIKARGEVMTYAQAVRRRAAVIPRTQAFSAERAAKASHVWYLEHDGGNPPDNLPLI